MLALFECACFRFPVSRPLSSFGLVGVTTNPRSTRHRIARVCRLLATTTTEPSFSWQEMDAWAKDMAARAHCARRDDLRASGTGPWYGYIFVFSRLQK